MNGPEQRLEARSCRFDEGWQKDAEGTETHAEAAQRRAIGLIDGPQIAHDGCARDRAEILIKAERETARHAFERLFRRCRRVRCGGGVACACLGVDRFTDLRRRLVGCFSHALCRRRRNGLCAFDRFLLQFAVQCQQRR